MSPVAWERPRVAGTGEPRRKVFGIGMFKTGTTTLGLAMETLGYRSSYEFWPILPRLAPYFDPNPRAFVPFHEAIRRRADGFDFLCDGPWLFLFRDLSEWYPESLFVLTLRRDAESVAASDLAMWRRIGLLERWKQEGGPEPTEAMFIERYERHNEAVRRHFESRPERLLEVCWETDPRPWSTLCGFLGRPAPRVPFPHANPRPSRLRRRGAGA